LVFRGEIPQEIIAEVQKYLKKLRVQHLSVRSSVVGEDSSGASYAGLFDTFLNVNSDFSQVLETIKKCWVSLFNERAIVYRIAKGTSKFEGMAVIIQEMIPAQVSGVTFTVHPLNGKLLLIEASYGLGDLIVGGRVQPDQYIFDRETLDLIDERVGNKFKMSVLEKMEVKIINTPQKLAKRPVLSNTKAMEIANVCLKVEKTFNYPQDIEWCISNDNLWLLQSRPETSLK
jgi:pyruvate,water dikinase